MTCTNHYLLETPHGSPTVQGKSRSGGQSVLYRKLAFSQGGRFIPMEATA